VTTTGHKPINDTTRSPRRGPFFHRGGDISAPGAVTATAGTLTLSTAGNVTFNNAANQLRHCDSGQRQQRIAQRRQPPSSSAGRVTVNGNLTVNAVGRHRGWAAHPWLVQPGLSNVQRGRRGDHAHDRDQRLHRGGEPEQLGANNVSVTDANAIVLGTSSVGTGTLTVTATGANTITQTGAITQVAAAGAASFTTGAGPITLTNAGQQLHRCGEPDNTGANPVQITDTNAIQLGTINIGNNLTVNAVRDHAERGRS